jgi:hypothetical protein
MLDGKEVYRKELGGKPVVGKVALEMGKRYPITITYFQGGSAAFWMEQVGLEGNRPIEALIPPGDTLSVWMEEMKLPPLE